MDLLNSLSSARKEIEERRYSRFRGSNISISPEPPQANSPKPPMPRNHFKKITEKPNDFGVLHRSISQTKLDMHKRVTSPTGNMTTRLKINDIHLDLSRIYDSSVRSPTRNRIRDYKIDAAKLLVSSISNSVINRFRTFRKNTEILGNYSKNRYGASINYDLGVNRSLDHTVRRSERDFTGKIVRKKDELWAQIMNTSSKYESQPGSIANTPRNLNHSSHHIKGFQNFIKNIDILDEKPPIVEVIYEENKHKKRQSLLGSFIQSSTSNLRSSQSTKKTYDRSISNKLVTFTRSLMPIIKRKLLVSLYAIKESAIKQRHDEEFVLNSPPFKKEFLNKGNPKSKEIDLVWDIKSRIGFIRSSRNKARFSFVIHEFTNLLLSVFKSYHKPNFNWLLTCPKMIEDKTETLSKVLKTIFIKSTFKDIKDTSLLQEKLKTVIRMSKHLQKDINYRCKICFDHWKTTKHCKFIVYDPLKTITISQTFEILIQKQTKSFFTALKIAEQKQESLKTHKLGLVYQGFKHLLPYYKHLKQRYWNKWTVQTEIKLDVSQRIALNRVFRILGRFETSYYQRFLSLIKFYVSSRVKSVQNLCRIFKSKFKIRFENLNIHRNIELLSSKQLKVYYKKIGMSNLGLSINKRIRNCRKSGFDNILTHAKSLYFSSLPLPKLRKL